MPTTRKKVNKTVYKDENDTDEEENPFCDSGSDAIISEHSSSSEDNEGEASSAEEFVSKLNTTKNRRIRKTKFTKSFLNKINRQSTITDDAKDSTTQPVLFSVKDMTEEDKLLPPILNLSESDSSDEDVLMQKQDAIPSTSGIVQTEVPESEKEHSVEYKDVWAKNTLDDCTEFARNTFHQLEKHKISLEETKASIHRYSGQRHKKDTESNVSDLLAEGEDLKIQKSIAKHRSLKNREDSESEFDDWEEVTEALPIPQQGIELVVDFPDAVGRKSKTIDVEMMMRRKINRVKKEYQIYMHKVHVLCWLGHGNYISRVLNDQEVMAAALSLVPSKICYPGERVDMKYVELITAWYKDKLTLKPDKNYNKFKPKAPPLKDIIIKQIKSKTVSSYKLLVFIFVSMLRSLGLQSRIMFNFVTLPLKPPNSELCSLSSKNTSKTDKEKIDKKDFSKKQEKKASSKHVAEKSKKKTSTIAQLDGNFDESCSSSDNDFDNIMQLDGQTDNEVQKQDMNRVKAKNKQKNDTNKPKTNEGPSPPKRPRRITRSMSPHVSDQDLTQLKRTHIKKNTGQEINNVNNDKIISKHFKINPDTNNDECLNKTTSAVKGSRNQKQKIDSSKIAFNTNLLLLPVTNDGNHKQEQENSNDKKFTSLAQKHTYNESECKSKNEKIKSRTKSATGSEIKTSRYFENSNNNQNEQKKSSITIIVTDYDEDNNQSQTKKLRSQLRHCAHTENNLKDNSKNTKTKSRTKSAPTFGKTTSQYFGSNNNAVHKVEVPKNKNQKSITSDDDNKRISHRDLRKSVTTKNDVTKDLINIVKGRVKEAKTNSRSKVAKSNIVREADDDSDYLLEEDLKSTKRCSDSEEDFKPAKKYPKSSNSNRKLDRRVLSSDEESSKKKTGIDVWCEIFVEELEQWVSVDVVKSQVHCTNEIYKRATQPVSYIVGWDNNNYLKDLTRRYVPHWNTITRKLRVEPDWWITSIKPWIGPRNARDREEDEKLDQLQLEAPLPKTIAEYKNHPLYALRRHLLKFEAIYPPDAATLGFVRGEAVYARDCVYTCRSRDTWLKDAKVVRLGEKPYKVVKARPKWDKLSNKVITDLPLEVFGQWQVKDYEPPTAENGIVPRNAYGNVEMFKDCMLPKGTVHIKLPGLNRVAKKLNIDCAPAMTGFDFNGGWTHPVFDGFVVCKEFEEILREAWQKDLEEAEKREQEKTDSRVYGNWRRLIKGLLIRERLKEKYGFENPCTSKAKKPKAPKLVVKKRI